MDRKINSIVCEEKIADGYPNPYCRGRECPKFMTISAKSFSHLTLPRILVRLQRKFRRAIEIILTRNITKSPGQESSTVGD